MFASQCLHPGVFVLIYHALYVILQLKWKCNAALSHRNATDLPQADIFQEFTIKEDLVGFQINLTVLLDCLNIFGGSAMPGKYETRS